MIATQTHLPDKLSIRSLRGMYLSGRTTPREVIEEIIRRCREHTEMNIWITAPDIQVISPYLERLAAMDPLDSPLWGIPFAVKDNIDLAGVPTTAGCPDFAYVPDEHATVVQRLIAAGAVPLGKTNLDQFATGLVGTRSPYGETRNALRPELISGGSSSGSAVAVAAGQAAFALGTDTAGSGRVPAALNGIVGYKPGLGAWPTTGVVPACASIDSVSVFAQTAEEAFEVDRFVRGIDDTDPWSRSKPLPALKRPQKLCLPKGPLDFYGPFARQYERAWQKAVERLKRHDIPIEYVDIELFTQAAMSLYQGPWVAERWAGLGAFVESHPESVLPVTEHILRTGALPEYDAVSLFQTIHRLQSLKLKARKLLHDAVLVMPTCGGTWTRDQVRRDPVSANSEMGRYTNHCNLLDLCAIAVPFGEADSCLPFGITLFALSDQEHLLRETAASVSALAETILVAVCGLHMRGFALERQMLDCGARFVRESVTSADYRMIKLPTLPAKPGLIRRHEDGASVQVELWEMPLPAFGRFAASIPAPLGIGKVELEDGSKVPGFICESYAAMEAEDITDFGGWRGYSMK